MIKTLTVTALLGGALLSLGAVSRAVPDSAPSTSSLPWTTVSELEGHVVEAMVVSGCPDPRRMGLYIAVQGGGTYYVVVSADQRWVILRPHDAEGLAWIWYGTIAGTGQLLVERSLLGTSATDMCPFLTRHST